MCVSTFVCAQLYSRSVAATPAFAELAFGPVRSPLCLWVVRACVVHLTCTRASVFDTLVVAELAFSTFSVKSNWLKSFCLYSIQFCVTRAFSAPPCPPLFSVSPHQKESLTASLSWRLVLILIRTAFGPSPLEPVSGVNRRCLGQAAAAPLAAPFQQPRSPGAESS